MLSQHALLGQSGGDASYMGLFVFLAFVVLAIVGSWRTFEKANQPGWGCIVPIYNLMLMLEIAGKPMWWLLLFLIPIVSFYPAIVVPIAIARNFRKGTGFGLGLLFLPFVFYPILGLGNAEYDPDVVVF